MSGQDKDRPARGTALPARDEYEIGYGKPPKATRFKSGQSGNPRGRPKGAKNRKPALNEERLKDIILDEAYRKIKVRDGERHVSIPIAQAVVRSLAVNAAKGQHRAQRLFSELLAATETSNKRLHDEWLETAIAYKVDWERELERRAQLGTTGPEPIPHPDDIKVDLRSGQVWIAGPATKEEKARHDRFKKMQTEFRQELSDLRQDLLDDPATEHRDLIEEDIANAEEVLGMLGKILPD